MGDRPLIRIGYADPPYPGCAHLYKDHPDYAGEVDHAALVERLRSEYDGWVRQRELSRFVREDGRWFYVDGDVR